MNDTNATTFVATTKKVFAPAVTGLADKSQAAARTISEKFLGIMNVMNEGNVTPDLLNIALTELVTAKLAVDAAIAYGFNQGKTTY